MGTPQRSGARLLLHQPNILNMKIITRISNTYLQTFEPVFPIISPRTELVCNLNYIAYC